MAGSEEGAGLSGLGAPLEGESIDVDTEFTSSQVSLLVPTATDLPGLRISLVFLRRLLREAIQKKTCFLWYSSKKGRGVSVDPKVLSHFFLP